MAIVTIPSITLQDTIFTTQGLPAAGYWVYFYDKETGNKRWAYRKNEDGKEVQADNPLQLDNNGNFPYKVYYRYDEENPNDQYHIKIRCKNTESCLPDCEYFVPYVQNVKAIEPNNAILSSNLFIDGQWNISLFIPDDGYGLGYVDPNYPILPLAGTSWLYIKEYAPDVPIQNKRDDVDRIFVRLITEAEKIEEANPKYYCNIICESYGAVNPPLRKILGFMNPNVLWGSNSLIKLKFYGWRDGDNFDVNLVIVRSYGQASTKPPETIPIAVFTIDSETPKVYSVEFNLTAAVIPADNGDDGYISINFVLPIGKTFNFKATNFYMAKMASTLPVSEFIYPTENNSLARMQQLQSSLASSHYTTDNSMQETGFSIRGYTFLDNIGEIVRYPKGAKVDPDLINLMKCDGRTLDAGGFYPKLGIRYKRLYNKLGFQPKTFNMLQTEETPNWFNAISSTYIEQFAADNNLNLDFQGDLSKLPAGYNIADLWLETTFTANMAVDENFTYARMYGNELRVCCHSFDITADYSQQADIDYGSSTKSFSNSNISYPPYFRMESYWYNGAFYQTTITEYKKGIDPIVAQTTANYSVKDNYFYLTININKDDYLYRSGLVGNSAPSLTSQTYNIGFPAVPSLAGAGDKKSHMFGVSLSGQGGTANINYFLFSPWCVVNRQQVVCTSGSSQNLAQYTATITGAVNAYFLNKGWGFNIIYKQSASDTRTPKQPNVLFNTNNSVITYAIQHKALFTQRCLYAIKFPRVKGGDWLGLKTKNNTNSGSVFDVVIWWSVDGEGSAPSNVTAGDFREIKVPAGTSAKQLADLVANEINNKGSTIFSIPNIPSDDNFDYYIRF